MRLILIAFFIVCSCSSKKDILLFQDTESSISYNLKFEDLQIKTDDILRIKISSKSADLASLYNKQSLTPGQGSLLSYQIDGFLVNSKGFINIPTLNPIFVKGLTLNEASVKIKKLLDEQDVLKNASVDVKFLNSYFTIFSEVNSPGRYNFLKIT